MKKFVVGVAFMVELSLSFKIYHRFIGMDVDSVVQVQHVRNWCREFRNG
jgi:hypothetical protein